MDSEATATLLVTAIALRDRTALLKLDTGRLAEGILQLAEFRILSAGQIASVLDTSVYMVNKILKDFKKLDQLSDKRGRLNPLHLEAISYMLSLRAHRTINRDWVKRILNEGTSPSVLSDLTGISISTIHRIKEEK